MVAFGSSAGAMCLDPAICFCALKPDVSQALVRVEVSASVDGLADLQILGASYYDPQCLLGEGALLEGVETGNLQIAAGETWLLLLDMEGEQLQIIFGVEEVDGLLPCDNDPDFPGATADNVAGAVLSDDCWAAVHDLGVWVECNDTQASCGLSTVTLSSRPGDAFWMFVLLALGFAGFRFGRPSTTCKKSKSKIF